MMKLWAVIETCDYEDLVGLGTLELATLCRSEQDAKSEVERMLEDDDEGEGRYRLVVELDVKGIQEAQPVMSVKWEEYE